jgi:hypothetical protein
MKELFCPFSLRIENESKYSTKDEAIIEAIQRIKEKIS